MVYSDLGIMNITFRKHGAYCPVTWSGKKVCEEEHFREQEENDQDQLQEQN